MNGVQHLHELTAGQLLAIDGKTLRRSDGRRRKKGPLHIVSAWGVGQSARSGADGGGRRLQRDHRYP